MPYLPAKCPRDNCGAPMKLWVLKEFHWLCIICHCQTLNEPTEFVDIAAYLAHMEAEYPAMCERVHVPEVMLELLHVPPEEEALFGDWDVPDVWDPNLGYLESTKIATAYVS